MILIVNRSKKYANSITEIFHYMGILSHTATPTEALTEVSTSYRAVLIVDPETLPDPCDFIRKLRSYSPTPIFSISTLGKKVAMASMFDGCFEHAISSARLASEIAQISKSLGLYSIGDYRLAGINATCDLEEVYFFETPIPLTKTEKMILRYLIRTYPLPQKSLSIAKYAFKPNRSPAPESIKTHICSINKKFKEMMDGRALISPYGRNGYVIYTPEIISKIKNNENMFV